MRMTAGWMIAGLLLAACGSEAAAPPAKPAPPVSQPPPPSVPSGFEAVGAALVEAPFTDARLVVGDAEGILWQAEKGRFDADAAVPVASASKLLAAIVIFRLVERGEMSLDDRPQDYLDDWPSDPADPRSDITLEMLLSFTSGLWGERGEVGCLARRFVLLDECVREIRDAGLGHAPGDAFAYGPNHLQVAAAMAEAASGKRWYELVESELVVPLGLGSTDFGGRMVTNPRIAGGAQSSARDYGRVLQALLAGDLIADLESFIAPRTAALAKLATPDAAIASGDWAYALGNWRECDFPDYVRDCADARIFSSAGAFGWMPWIDLEHGYWGLVARQGSMGSSEASTALEQRVQPLIEAAL